MVEKFTRAIVVLERETYDAQKRVELLKASTNPSTAHLEHARDRSTRKSWEGLDINKELTKALSAVDDARAEYAKSLPKISPATDTEGGDRSRGRERRLPDSTTRPPSTKDFIYWLKAGFAFTLPLFGARHHSHRRPRRRLQQP